MGVDEKLLELERLDDTAVVTALSDLGELAFEELEKEAAQVLDLLDQDEVKNVVVDFRDTDYYGSTALGFFVKLWKRVSSRNGRMFFCAVSPHEREILKVTQLDGLWPICDSKEEALEALGIPSAECSGRTH